MIIGKNLFSNILKGAIFLAAFWLFLTYQAGYAQSPQGPNDCPQGQEEANGCKWAQHRVTGNCMWLPANSVSGPWVELPPEIPRGVCPPLAPEDTATATATATSTSTATSTATATPIQDPGSSTATATATATSVYDPGSPTATATSPGQPRTTPLPPTPGPHPPREHPGGPGNLGFIVIGSLAGFGLLALAGFTLPRFIAKKRS
jgi:hypothetical protein